MTKLLKIDNCYDCTFHTKEGVVVKCVKLKDIPVVHGDDIPLFCPLPDASQPVVEADGLYRCPECGGRILKPGGCYNEYCSNPPAP